ncbi:toast rack family protein [Methanosarcina sp. KYL-1]|uniref:toast rack family protein n=1 Tax=Methanosarcina sp. KYL-1 TaxID=2602068 RepID=UPI002100CF2D|nr:toast rack family protein [Methanosarcina sp. KYL-1]
MIIVLLVSGCAEVGELQTESRSVDLGGAASADVELEMYSGEMNIIGGTVGAEELMDAEFRYNVDAWKPEIEYNIHEGRGRLIVRQPEIQGGIAGGSARNEWDLRLKEDVPMDLKARLSSGDCSLNMASSLLKKLDIGSSSGDIKAELSGNQPLLEEVEIDQASGNTLLDLSGEYPALSSVIMDSSSGGINAGLTGNFGTLSLVEIELSSGDASVDLTGNWSNDSMMEVAVSSGDLTLRVPRNVGVYVEVDSVSGDITANDFRLEDSAYVNDAYGESEVTLRVKASSSSGNIKLLFGD